MALFQRHYSWPSPVRSIGLSISDFVYENMPVQLDLYHSHQTAAQREKLAKTVDSLRHRFGSGCVQRAIVLLDRELTHAAPEQEFALHFKR